MIHERQTMNPVEDIAYVRVAAPNLDLMETFLTDFGLQRAQRTDAALHMRGHGRDPVIHITELGESRQIGFAFKVLDKADLDSIAAQFGQTVEPRAEPGGGFVVKIEDPDGNLVELVQGVEPREPAQSRRPHVFNPIEDRKRYNAAIREETRPSQVMRLGHVALYTARFAEMFAFYRDVLGMQVSDSYYGGVPENVIAAFMHCGLGQSFVDHHTIALLGTGRTGFDHMAFEVLDLDDLMVGNQHLQRQARWTHSWGVGRHFEGSQIFDYWRDPFDNKIEHWTDGDLVNDDYRGSNKRFAPELAADMLTQWGPPLTPDFMR
jgi:catechol 2,3-dioxygenase-like lactoylglutathione lyase family enzyme